MPIAATRMSAARQKAAMSRVRLWQIVTVASAPFCEQQRAIGLPTMSLRPITTACLPVDLDARDLQHAHHAVPACRAGSAAGPAAAGRRSPGGSRRRPWPGAMASRIASLSMLLRQRQLHQDAVHVGSRVERVGSGSSSSACAVPAGRRCSVLLKPAFVAGDLLVAHVDGAGGVVAHQHGRQVRHHAGAQPRASARPRRLRRASVPQSACRRSPWPSCTRSARLRGSPGGYSGLPARSRKNGVVAAGKRRIAEDQVGGLSPPPSSSAHRCCRW